MSSSVIFLPVSISSSLIKIRKLAEDSKTAKEYRENLLIDFAQKKSPTDIAILFIKKEVKKLL